MAFNFRALPTMTSRPSSLRRALIQGLWVPTSITKRAWGCSLASWVRARRWLSSDFSSVIFPRRSTMQTRWALSPRSMPMVSSGISLHNAWYCSSRQLLSFGCCFDFLFARCLADFFDWLSVDLAWTVYSRILASTEFVEELILEAAVSVVLDFFLFI